MEKPDLKINKIILSENKVDIYYDKIVDYIRRIAIKMNDDDLYELHERLKKFFNSLI